MRFQMSPIFAHDLGLRLVAAQPMAKRGLDDGFGHDGAVGEGDCEGVGDGARGGVVVGGCEGGVFDAGDAAPEGFDEGGCGGGGSVGVVGGEEAVMYEHYGDHVLCWEGLVWGWIGGRGRGVGIYTWMQWSRSAKLSMGLCCLSIMRMHASWVRMVTDLMSSADLLLALSCP